MIKVSELRVGNFVLGPNDVPIKITADILYGISEDEFYKEKTNRIPLTPAILESCGFQKMELKTRNKWYRYILCLLETNGDFYLNGFKYQVKIQYVHQLQNLYFALTGEELEIKL